MIPAHEDPAVLLVDARTTIEDLQVALDVDRRAIRHASVVNHALAEEADLLRLGLDQPPAAGRDTFAEAQAFAELVDVYGAEPAR